MVNQACLTGILIEPGLGSLQACAMYGELLFFDKFSVIWLSMYTLLGLQLSLFFYLAYKMKYLVAISVIMFSIAAISYMADTFVKNIFLFSTDWLYLTLALGSPVILVEAILVLWLVKNWFSEIKKVKFDAGSSI